MSRGDLQEMEQSKTACERERLNLLVLCCKKHQPW